MYKTLNGTKDTPGDWFPGPVRAVGVPRGNNMSITVKINKKQILTKKQN